MKNAGRASLLALGLVSAHGCAPNGCFLGRTRVLTPRGPRDICQLTPGDVVWSWCLDEQRPVERAVERLHIAKADLIMEVVAGEQRLSGVTPAHPVFDAARSSWLPVAELTLSSRVLAWHGAHAAKEATITTLAASRLASPEAVYNLTIAGREANYFAEGILVHNKSYDSGPSDESRPYSDAGVVVDAGRSDGGDAIEPRDGGSHSDDAGENGSDGGA